MTELQKKALFFSMGTCGAQVRTIYRNGDFVDGFIATVHGKPVIWEKTFCATRSEALAEARLFQDNAKRVYRELES